MADDSLEQPARDPEPCDDRGRERTPTVVALCASAGGLEAFKAFLTAMPADSGMAFVLVPHLDPTHDSLLVDILSRCTSMSIGEAVDGEAVQANCVYVLPPNKYMTIAGGALQLSGPVERGGPQTSIDLFLRSLADDQHGNSIGIVLSGSGAHGTSGLQAIKAAGGLVMVQDPATAASDGMPRSAIDSGIADFVLPVEQMPERLMQHVDYGGGGLLDPEAPEVLETAAADLDAILALVKERTRVDFRGYRKKVLVRRVNRRMELGRFESLTDYLVHLHAHPDEVLQLHGDLLIRVTSFFRDAEAFDALTNLVLVPLIRSKASDEPLRIWVPGCATGDEAYSIAMLCFEQLALAKKDCPLQVFATDVDEAPLEVARRGVYPSSIAADVSAERLGRFFTRLGNSGYAVNQSLRAAVVFAEQNLIADAPFSRLDLIACRNLLIYLEPDLQQKVLELFHFALCEGGCLLLGSSETIGRQCDLFETLSKKWRLFRRLGAGRPENVAFPILAPATSKAEQRASIGEAKPLSTSLASLMQRVLLAELEPAAVLVDHTFSIRHYHGPVRRYLDYPVPEPTQNLLALVADGLRSRLRLALQRALRDGELAVVPATQVRREGRTVYVRAIVKPVQAAETLLLLVKFEETAGSPSPPQASPEDESVVRQLEYELKVVREDHRSNTEELERSNEDLKAAHEEALSMNEELQSANEELETSKEELQSLNEEISTMNSQLQDKVEELQQAHSDVSNLMDATDLAVLFLDVQMCIRRFTPAVTKLLGLQAGDVGRKISTFAPLLIRSELESDAEHALEHRTAAERSLETDDGRHFLRRIVPYLGPDGSPAGVVVTLLDVTATMASLFDARRMAAVLDASSDAIIMLDLEGRITSWNRGAAIMFGYTEAEALSLHVESLVPDEMRAEAATALRQVVNDVCPPATAISTVRTAKDGRRIDVLTTTTLLVGEQGEPLAIAETSRDISDLMHRERATLALNAELERRINERTEELAESEGQLRGILQTAVDAIITADNDGVIVSANPAAVRLFGYDEQSLVGRGMRSLMLVEQLGPEVPFAQFCLELAGSQGSLRELACRMRDGTVFPADVALSSYEDGNGPMFTAIIRDIGERKSMEQHLVAVRLDEQARIARDMHDGLGGLLTGMAMLAKTVHVSLERMDSPLAVQAAALVDYLREADKQSRQIAYGLMPVDVMPEGLSVAMKRLASRYDTPEGPRCTYSGPDRISSLHADVCNQLYYIAQEAVGNAFRHGRPSHVQIALANQDGRVSLSVRDDGVGLDAVTNSDGKGMGLQTMHYRAAQIGGKLTIRGGAKKGTEVRCTLPVLR